MIDILDTHSFFKDKNIESLSLLQDQGYCNENYLLQTNESKYIVRKFIRDDIDRDFEWHVLGLAYEHGITATPLIYDKGNGFMAFSFLEGEHKNSLQTKDVSSIVQKLKQLHSISLTAQPIELTINRQTEEVIDALKILRDLPKEYVLCHNDLNVHNIFFGYEVKFIDFEYAGVNDRYFDLACISVEYKLDTKMEKFLLDSYFEGSYNMTKLDAYKVIYRALCKEWFDNML